MIRDAARSHRITALPLLALALVAGAGSLSAIHAEPAETPREFWHIPVRALPGAWQDSTVRPPDVENRCSFRVPAADSIREQPRTITVRFRRSPRVEARPDFGGYRIWRVERMDPRNPDQPDTTGFSAGSMTYWMLIRRFSINPGDEALWNFSRVDSLTLQFRCGSELASDEWVTFVDPDSNGAFVKVCRRVDNVGRCLTPGDSVWKLVAPPGPHDGVRIWYSVTYEAFNTIDNTYEDLFVPDTSDWSRCRTPGVASTCPNLNSPTSASPDSLHNAIDAPVEATGGPTPNLQTVAVVPNPFRARETWDRPGQHELQFIHLPSKARIRIYTVAGELVRELAHDDAVRDFERWDLKNADGKDVASGIYMYRVEAGSFSAQSRFIVIR